MQVYKFKTLEVGDQFTVIDLIPNECLIVSVPSKGTFDLPLQALPASSVNDGKVYTLHAIISIGNIRIPVVQ